MSARQKMLAFVNWKMRVTITDTREIVGIFMAFDKHMNIILGDAEEFRLVKDEKKKGAPYVEERRLLGLVLMRGDAVVSIKPVSPPAPAPKYKPPPGGAPAVAALPGTPGTLPGMIGMPGMPGGGPPMGPRPGMPIICPPAGMPMRPPPGGAQMMRPPPHMMFRPGGPPMMPGMGPPRPGMMPPGGPRPGMPPQMGRGGPPGQPMGRGGPQG